MNQKRYVLEVWGDFACFTQPAFKVERFSYPIITPAAARSIFRAIYWKPNFIWQVRRVEMLNMPRYVALRRNEIKGRAPSEKVILSWAKGNTEVTPIIANDPSSTKGRTQRQTMALIDVRYRLHAEIHPWPEHVDAVDKIEEQFIRRARKGQCIFQPSFGLREFVAYFAYIGKSFESSLSRGVDYNSDLGLMSYDTFDLSKPGNCYSQKMHSVFHACIKNGVMDVPLYSSNSVIKSVSA
jgi:CRISPR-associated protein Cas5d